MASVETWLQKTKHSHKSVAGSKKPKKSLDDEWPESIFHHVGSQSVSYLLSVQCEVFKSSELR